MRSGSYIGTEDTGGCEDQLAIGIGLGGGKGDIVILPRNPCCTFQPGTGGDGTDQIAHHTHRNPPQLGMMPNRCGQQAIGEGGHHAAVQAAMGIAMAIHDAQPMPELIVHDLMKIGAVMGGVGSTMARMNKTGRWISF